MTEQLNGSNVGWLTPYLVALLIVCAAFALGPSIVALVQWAVRRRRAS